MCDSEKRTKYWQYVVRPKSDMVCGGTGRLAMAIRKYSSGQIYVSDEKYIHSKHIISFYLLTFWETKTSAITIWFGHVL